MILNELQDEGGLNRLLQNRLNMLGSAPSPALMPEVGPTLCLENDRVEWRVYKGEYLWSVRITVAAVVGEFSIVWVNPSSQQNANVFTVNRLKNWSASGVDFVTGISQLPTFTLPIGIANPRSCDTRAPRVLNQSILTGTGTVIPAFTGMDQVRPGETSEVPWVIRAGIDGLCIRTGAVNQTLNVQLSGYMRKAFPNELG